MEWKDVLSSFAMQLVLYISPVLAGLLAAWLLAKARSAWSEFHGSKPDLAYWLDRFARMAVLAAEQAKIGGLIEDKREYAFEIIEKLLAEKGWKVDLDLIYAAIEAAVMDEFNRE